MTRLLRNPKTLLFLIIALSVFLVSLGGGALGNAFNGGFLGSPIAHIQLPAESVLTDPLIGNFYLTNTMLATWLTIAILLVLSLVATRKVSIIPGRLQNLFEVLLEFFLNLMESIAGPENARKFFPLVMTIFLFILAANWVGILPGFATIGRFEPGDEVIHHAEVKAEKEHSHLNLDEVQLQVFDGNNGVAILPFGSIESVITGREFEEHGVDSDRRAGLLVPFLRSSNTDVNTTLAIAIVAMLMVHYWGLTSLGIFGHLGKFLNFKGGPIGFAVGILEAIGEVARLISFTFRLFGNIFAGEVLLAAMAFLLPLIGIIPFLGLELFVGAIQAFIFAMLTLVFASLATISHNSEEH